MKFLIIFNRQAGQVKDIKLNEIMTFLQQKNHQVFCSAVHEFNVDKFTSFFYEKETKRYVICLGGDGTLNTVVDRFVSQNILDVPLMPYPSGTANDFAYQLYGEGIQLSHLVDAAEKRQYQYLDVGKVNEYYFINVLAAGSFADVAYQTPSKWKQKIGMWAYWFEAIRRMSTFHAIKFYLQSNENTESIQCYLLLVLNGRGAGGFKKLVPGSSLVDGKLDIILIKEPETLLELASLFPKILAGEHLQDHRIEYFQQSKLEIDTDHYEEIASVIDGEKGPSFPLKIEVLPAKLAFVTC